MARRPTKSQRRQFATLIAKLEPGLRAAFEESAKTLRDGLDWRALVAALERGDVEAAITALNVDAAAFYAYAQAKTAAFVQGGALTSSSVPFGGPNSIGFRFDMASPRAEAWIRQNVGLRITELVDEQLAVIRDTINGGYSLGRGPLDIGRDLAGRVQAGVRQGGVIGLDSERARRFLIVTRGMESAEGVRDLVIEGRDGRLRMRYQVNPATAQRIFKAYRAGGPVPAADRAKSAAQYQNALLKSRGETIARTETAQAVRGAQIEEWRQVMEREGIPGDAILKTWIHGGGVKDPRPHHVAANGMVVRGIDVPFVLANGASLQYPHDPRASGSETINCTCNMEVRLDPAYGAEE